MKAKTKIIAPLVVALFSFILVILIYSSHLKLFVVEITKQKSSGHFATCQVCAFRV